MLCPILATAMIFFVSAFTVIGLLIFNPHYVTSGTPAPCPDGRVCPWSWQCCAQGCCAPIIAPSLKDLDEAAKSGTNERSYNPWYAQWPVLFLVGTLGGVVACCVWYACCGRGRRAWHSVVMCTCGCCARRAPSDRDSADSASGPPRYSRCSSFYQPPPPYSEVTSKPDLYPLVLSCGDADGKGAGNYLMVHYFRNYLIRAPGSISATSTAESLNSSFIFNAANEANSAIPPPYSCAHNYEEVPGGCARGLLHSLSSLTEPPPLPSRETSAPRPRDQTIFRENLINSPVQPLNPTFDLELELIDCEMYCDGGCKPRVGASPPAQRSHEDLASEHEPFGLRNLFTCPSPELAGACDSPPRPTSPTQTSRDSTLRRLSEEKRQRRLDNIKKIARARKASLYMPLSMAHPVRTSKISPGAKTSSRSAPATPCGALVPNLLNLTQRMSSSRHSSRSSRFDEESNPLLMDADQPRGDHKF